MSRNEGEIKEYSRNGREEHMMKYLQRLGKSLMLPVSVMPIAAILKGIGYWIDPVGFGANNAIAAFLIQSGGVIIDQLPLLFTIGIVIGMNDQKDSMVVMCSVISFIVVEGILSKHSVALIMGISISEVPVCFESTPNALIGILVGLMCSFLYQRYSHVELPKALMVFSGKRFAIIVCTVSMMLFSLLLMGIWPVIYNICVHFGEWILELGPTGAGVYAFFNRLLIPFGLHHALNSVFWFDVAGINDIGKFWGTVSGGVVGETGMYQAGFFPVMMFGLPAAVLAMYHCARPEKKKQVGAILLSSAIASFLTGVTEPIEFSFMFVAPVLYVIHALLTGVFVFIAASMKWLAGFGFSAGMIDYILSMKSPYAYHIWMLIPLGLICAIIYYNVFRFMILHFNLLTPGREIDDQIVGVSSIQTTTLTLESKDYDELAIFYVEALGGVQNIVSLGSCLTRLRVELKDMSLVDEEGIMATGVSGMVKLGHNGLQIIVGTQVDAILDSMNDIIG